MGRYNCIILYRYVKTSAQSKYVFQYKHKLNQLKLSELHELIIVKLY